MVSFLLVGGVLVATLMVVVNLVPIGQASAGSATGVGVRRRRSGARATLSPIALPLPSPAEVTLSPWSEESGVLGLRVLPTRRITLWIRLRASVVLVGLAAFLGLLLAGVGVSLALGVAILVRSAAG